MGEGHQVARVAPIVRGLRHGTWHGAHMPRPGRHVESVGVYLAAGTSVVRQCGGAPGDVLCATRGGARGRGHRGAGARLGGGPAEVAPADYTNDIR